MKFKRLKFFWFTWQCVHQGGIGPYYFSTKEQAVFEAEKHLEWERKQELEKRFKKSVVYEN